MPTLPEPTIERLLHLTRVLDACAVKIITSSEIEALTGWSSYTIRKDISYLSGELSSGAGYSVNALRAAVDAALGLGVRRSCCVVGLGRLGSAYLNFPGFAQDGFDLVAGFDSSVNRIEILRSPVPLYPAFKMGEVISRFGIQIALLCVPPEAAQPVADRLVAAGILGIINYAPVVLQAPPGLIVRNVYFVDELRAVAARIACEAGTAPACDEKPTAPKDVEQQGA